MNAPSDVITCYIDQNILSRLRKDQAGKTWLLEKFRALQEENFIFVYSATHLDECRAAAQPKAFFDVIEELPLYLMCFQDASDPQMSLLPGGALPRDELLDQPQRLVERLLQVFSFASGWLGEDGQGLKNEMALEVDVFWKSLLCELKAVGLGEELEALFEYVAFVGLKEMLALIQNLPLQDLRTEWGEAFAELRENLPASYAQLDERPDEQVVTFVLSCLGERYREAVQRQFPQDFWRRIETRQTGELAGFALFLFMCGLTRDRRVKRGSTEQRVKHFLGQFRDGCHIENAARCEVFITADRGAARLAKSIYAYAGIETMVLLYNPPEN